MTTPVVQGIRVGEQQIRQAIDCSAEGSDELFHGCRRPEHGSTPRICGACTLDALAEAGGGRIVS